MSLRTCSWLLPQNEQRYGTLGPLVLLLLVVLTRLPRSIASGRSGRLPGSTLRLLRSSARDTRALAPRAARGDGSGSLRDQRRPLGAVDRVDDAIVLGLFGRHEPVAIRIHGNLLDRLPGVARENRVVQLHQVLPLAHLDHRVRSVAAEPARALVDHDPAVGQGVALALGAGREQNRGHRRRLAQADRADRGPQVLHRVVDREPGRHDTAGRIDVQADVLLGILRLQEQELGDDEGRAGILDHVPDEDDPLLQEAGADVGGAFPPAGPASKTEPGSVASVAALASAELELTPDGASSSRCGRAGCSGWAASHALTSCSTTRLRRSGLRKNGRGAGRG